MKKIILLIVCFFIISINIKASIVVMDAESGRVLYSENKDERKLIASTPKIMTSIIALENGNLSDIYEVHDEIDEANGSMIYIQKGEKMYLNDLLYGLMLRSGNDAAMIIASNVMQYDNFINKMNLKAQELNMYNTTYENPHGLNDKTKNYSTAYDLALLMKYAIKNKEFLKITSTKKYKTKTDTNEYIWYNKNDLLSSYKYTVSGKIGYTKSSGQVFVSYAKKDNKKLIVASIDENNKFELHKNLYEKYFNLYKNYKIFDKYTFSINSKNYKNYYIYIKNDVNLLLTERESKDLIVTAKIKEKFDKNTMNAGYLEFRVDNKVIHKEPLYYIKHAEKTNRIKNIIKNLFRNSKK